MKLCLLDSFTLTPVLRYESNKHFEASSLLVNDIIFI